MLTILSKLKKPFKKILAKYNYKPHEVVMLFFFLNNDAFNRIINARKS